MIKHKLVKASFGLLVSSSLLLTGIHAEERSSRGKGGQMRGVMMAGVMLLKKLDKDGNGELSAAEIESASSVLRGMDVDGDGKLTQGEFGGGAHGGSESTADRMKMNGGKGLISDQNGDGKITADDLPERMRGHFSKMDVNGDGELDANEKTLIESKLHEKMGAEGFGKGGKKAQDPLEGPVKPKRPSAE